jgi:hypothetical protein
MSDEEYGEEEIYGELEPDFEAQEEGSLEAEEDGVAEAAEQDKQSEEDILSEEEAEAEEAEEAEAEERFTETEDGEEPEALAAETKSESARPVAPARRAQSQRPRIDPLARYSQTPKEKLIVADEDRKTSAFLQRAEMTRVLAIRAEQLSKNPTVFLTAGLAGAKAAHEIARLELLAKRCPLMIERKIGTTDAGEEIVERWRVNEMSLGFHTI